MLAVGWPSVASAQEGEQADKQAQEQTEQQGEEQTDEPAAEAEDGESGDQKQAPMTYRVDGQILIAERGGEVFERFGLPCEGRAAAQTDGKLYVACGEKGLLVLSVEDPERPNQIGFQDLGGPVDSLFEANGRIWAQITRLEARPVQGAGGVTAVTKAPGAEQPTDEPTDKAPAEQPRAEVDRAPEKPPEEQAVTGEVVEVRPGTVVIDQASGMGLSRGDKVELYVVREVELGGGELASREKTRAVGQVVATSGARAQIELGVNEAVSVGTMARKTDKKITANSVAPPRPAGITSYELMVRPFLPLNNLGFGSVGSLSVAHAFNWPGMLEVKLDPFSFGIADAGNVLALSGDVSMSYDTPVFRIGLGAGVARLSDNNFNPNTNRTERDLSANFNITQVVRLGARDGLHLLAYNSFLLDEGEFVYGGTDGEIQVSLASVLDDTWLLMRGGGHASGHYYGELGLRLMATGNGGPKSLFVTATLGGAGVFDGLNQYGGPMVGFGLEYRN